MFYCSIHITIIEHQNQFTVTESRQVVAWGCGTERTGLPRGMGNFRSDRDILKPYCDYGFTGICDICQK